jgi:hypothetical protein
MTIYTLYIFNIYKIELDIIQNYINNMLNTKTKKNNKKKIKIKKKNKNYGNNLIMKHLIKKK